MVGLGMDKALVPVISGNFATYGYDNLFWLSAICATYALMGVGVAYIIRCKKEDRSVAISNAVTAGCGRYQRADPSLLLSGVIRRQWRPCLSEALRERRLRPQCTQKHIPLVPEMFYSLPYAPEATENLWFRPLSQARLPFGISFIMSLVLGFESKGTKAKG